MLYFWCEKLCPLGRTFFYFYGAKNYEGRGRFSPRNRGGVALFAGSLHSKPALLYSRLFPDFSGTPPGQKGIESGQNRSKVNIYLLGFVSPRDFRRQQTAKCKHIFEIWCWCVVSFVPFVEVFSSCPLVLRCQCFEDSGPVIGWLWSSGGVFLAFCPFVCFMLVVSLANMALFRVLRGFLEGFRVQMYVCMGLVLCVDCVAFVCVRV